MQLNLKQLDYTTMIGLVIAGAAIAGGLLLEGGSLHDLAQWAAALIVLGGTIGAVLLQTPLKTLKRACLRLRQVVIEPQLNPVQLIDEIVIFSIQARRSKLLSLEDEAEAASHPFLSSGLSMAVDGIKLPDIRKALELEITLEEERARTDARVFESAGGYAPTIGILGAVLGLIQVMKNLSNTDQVGHGIATAFVATIYGVGFANLLFLPLANKIKSRAATEAAMKELMLEGISAIVEGINPKLIRPRLEVFIPMQERSRARKLGEQKREAAA